MERNVPAFDLEAAGSAAYSGKPRQRAVLLAGAILLFFASAGVFFKAQRAQDEAAAQHRHRLDDVTRRLRCGSALDVAAAAVTAESGSRLCREYRRVCFDQEHVISFDPAHSPSHASAQPLPRMGTQHIRYGWAAPEGRSYTGPSAGVASFQFEEVSFRPAGALEAGPDLQQPRFNACLVPVVAWHSFPHREDQLVAHLAARLWALQASGAMSNTSLLTIGTPPGERLPAFTRHLLRPLSTNPVLTFAELSARGGAASGRPGRCFERAYLCAFGGQDGYLPGMHGAMQAVQAYYRVQPPGNPLRFDEGQEVLKVLIHPSAADPAGAGHAELLEQCNSYASWQLDTTGPIKRVQCRAAGLSSSDVLQALDSVRSADVLVSAPGPACVHWLGMADGSALLELRTLGSGAPAQGSLYANASEFIGRKLGWYALDVQEARHAQPDETKPGSAGGSPGSNLPFSAVAGMLQRIAAAGRSPDAYRSQAAQGQHHAVLLPSGKLQPGLP